MNHMEERAPRGSCAHARSVPHVKASARRGRSETSPLALIARARYVWFTLNLMTPRQHRLATFYATLASLRRAPITAATLAPLFPRFRRMVSAAALTSSRPSKAAILTALDQVQRETASVLYALLRDGTAAIPAPLRTVSPRWRLTDGHHVVDAWEPSAARSTEHQLVLLGLAPLAELVKLPRLPFGYCSVCDRIFVRILGQRYCSPLCTYRGSERARRDERRGYMRSYMRAYRAAQRARRQKET